MSVRNGKLPRLTARCEPRSPHRGALPWVPRALVEIGPALSTSECTPPAHEHVASIWGVIGHLVDADHVGLRRPRRKK
jgi:hypothetical protein